MSGDSQTITDANNHTTTLLYDNMNRLSEETNPLNFKTRHFYDEAGNLERIERQADSAASIWQITRFTYDALEQLETIEDPLNRITQFTY